MLVVLGIFLLFPSKQEQVLQSIPISKTVTQLPATTTDAITEESEAIETMEGYYVARSGRGDWENHNNEYTCDTFVIKSSGPLADYFLNMITQGNTVNVKDPQGNLMLNIELGNLSAADKAALKNSNPQNLIKLVVQKKVQVGKGVDMCFSFLNIVKVEE